MTTSVIRGYHPDFVMEAKGILTAYANAAAPGTLDTAATIAFGTREVNADLFVQTMRIRQIIDGAAGATTVEVFRIRSGVATSLGTITLNQGGGANAAAVTVPASAALRNLQPGDVVTAQFNARQTVTASGVSCELLCQ